METDFLYDKSYDNYSDNEFVQKITADFAFIWNNKAFLKVKSPLNLITEYNNKYKDFSKEKRWYLIIIEILKMMGNFHELGFLKYMLKIVAFCPYSYTPKELLDVIVNANDALYIGSKDCLLINIEKNTLFLKDNLMVKKIIDVKDKILSKCDDYLNIENLNKKNISDIVRTDVMSDKFFDLKTFYYDFFIIMFDKSYHEMKIKNKNLDNNDIKGICFNIIERMNAVFLKKDADKASNIFCFEFAKIKFL